MAADNSSTGTVTASRSLGWKELYKVEDWWAIWLGFLLIVAGLVIYLPLQPEGMDEGLEQANATMQEQAQTAPFRTVQWFEASDAKGKFKAASHPTGKAIKSFTSKPHGWKDNPVQAFYLNEEAAGAKAAKATGKYDTAKAGAAEAKQEALTAQAAAADAGYQNEALNAAAVQKIDEWRTAKSAASAAKKKTSVSSYSVIPNLILYGLALAAFFSIGMAAMGRNVPKFFLGFQFVFWIAVLAYVAAAQSTMKEAGIGYAAWAILFGLIIANTVGTPRWVMPAVQTEYYIKTGLVLLGAEILFGKILTIGLPGIFVAWIVTPIVLFTTYQFGQRVIKIPSKTLNVTISADMSVCGVSAAIATAAACRAKKEELTLAVGLSLVFTSIMMVAMPAFIKAVGMPEILGGAWMGGTIDATGAVAAAGAFLGEKALYTAATIKMIQNVLIGVVAFVVAIIWTTKMDRVSTDEKVGASEIWYRFPKFVIGFIVASIVFSLIYQSMGTDRAAAMIDQGVLSGWTKIFRGWFFCLAFVSIGLATNFRELAHYFKGGKPLILYVTGQSFNLCFTLFMAWLMFYKVFPDITAKL